MDFDPGDRVKLISITARAPRSCIQGHKGTVRRVAEHHLAHSSKYQPIVFVKWDIGTISWHPSHALVLIEKAPTSVSSTDDL